MIPRPRPFPAARRGGFTMVELLMVVLVMGMIAGMVMVDWRAMYPRAQLNSSVHELAAAIQGARSEAIARNAEFQLWYDLDGNSFETSTPFRAGGGLAMTQEERTTVGKIVLPAQIVLERVTIDGVEYHEGRVYARFDPLGSASDHTVTLRGVEQNAVFTVEVLPLTGLIRFHDGEYYREPVEEEDFR